MTPNTITDEMKVEQSDRESAALVADECNPEFEFLPGFYREGKLDNSPLCQAFARHRLNTPGLNQCIAELGDDEPFVVSRDGDGWTVRTISAWRVVEGETSERAAIVAWLRAHEHSGLVEPFDEAADYIERGTHLTPTEGENHG